MMETAPDPRDVARRIISQALHDLEVATGSVVKEVGLRRFETTRFEDVGRRHLMTVEIELERLPGHEWQT